FEQLVTESQRALYVHILAFVPRAADAEEVLQETNLAIWRGAADFEMGSNFRAWAFKIAYYRILKYREKRRRESLMFSTNLIDVMAEERTAKVEAFEGRRLALERCMEKLRPSDKELISDYYRKGASGA